MNEENFIVQFIPSKNCFLQFSNKWFQKLSNPKCSCLRLIHPASKQELWFTCAPQPNFGLNDCSVGINATFAQGLNINENELVVISSEERLISLHQVFLTPCSADDYEILEVSQDNVEVSLLNQIRVMYVKQVVSVWVSKTIHLKLTVERLEPVTSCGRLEHLTELVIENFTKNSRGNEYKGIVPTVGNIPNSSTFTQEKQVNHQPSFWSWFSEYLPSSVRGVLKCNEVEQQTTGLFHQPDNSQLLCRVHPFPHLNDPVDCCRSAHDEVIHPFNVFVNRRTLETRHFQHHETFVQGILERGSSVILCRLEAVLKRQSKSSNKKSNEDEMSVGDAVSVVVRLHLVEDSCKVFKSNTNVLCVYLSQFLRRLLDVEVGSKVKLKFYKPPFNSVLMEIKLLTAAKLDVSEAKAVCQQFEKRLASRGGVLVNNYCPLPVPLEDSSNVSVLVLLSPGDLECWPLTQPELQVCPVVMATELEPSLETMTGFDKVEKEVEQLTCVFGHLVKEGAVTLEFGLQLTQAQRQNIVLDNILITGKHGSGKSRLAKALYTAMAGPPHYVHVSILDCKPLKGKKPESVGKTVAENLEECLYYQPSVLVLEDLQCIACSPTNDLEPSQEASYFLRLATVLKELLQSVSMNQCVSVIATAESRTQVHPQLLSARGRHTFPTVLHIPALNKVDRLQILTDLLSTKLPSVKLPDLEDLAGKTEGCVARDLSNLIDRVLFKACQHQTQAVDSELVVTADDLDAGMQGFVPSDLVNVSLIRHSPHTFTSVGGLQQAKELLTEVLIWPTKYSEVFSQCPLRLERGVLLYGAPGTGKTLLASAVAGESGLNFITVKGPELLSKYIGASEEAVRNVFQKAQSAQPCILFFDEFDSLAPRRGHDSTGVTDRVVNQLLTQMDGVEALEGVWVLAAASRPDLLDPALLRPGRIGTLVHCQLPDQVERLAILRSLSTKLLLSDDADLTVIAAQTEGFTGADLQAILFTAQMTAYDSIHQDSVDELQMNSVESVTVSQSDLMVALQNTTPSLKLEDRYRFQQIYDRFEKSRGSKHQGDSGETVQRVTLA